MNHEKHLKNLLKKIIIETSYIQPRLGIIWISIPSKLKSKDENSSKNQHLELSGKEVDFYRNSLKKLREDTSTEYLRDNELKNKLNFLIWDVWLNRDESNDDFLSNKIKTFLDEICKPLKQYEVVFKINNLEIKKETKFWDYLIGSFSKEELIRKGFDEPQIGIYKISDFENKTLIFIKETGNNSSLIIERARKKAIFAIKLLQSYLSEKGFARDENLLFSLSTDYAIRALSNQKAGGGWKRDFSPEPFNYEDAFAEFTDKANEHYTLLSSFHPEIRNAVERVIYWIGKSVSEPDFDIKITLLFTALEVLLTTKNDGMKGERIAYRLVLLNSFFDKPSMHPADILEMYKMRSEIIHGAKIDIASESEYYELMNTVRETLDYYIKFAEKISAKKPLDVINALIKSQDSGKLEKWLSEFSDKNSQEVAKFLLEDLKKQQ